MLKAICFPSCITLSGLSADRINEPVELSKVRFVTNNIFISSPTPHVEKLFSSLYFSNNFGGNSLFYPVHWGQTTLSDNFWADESISTPP